MGFRQLPLLNPIDLVLDHFIQSLHHTFWDSIDSVCRDSDYCFVGRRLDRSEHPTARSVSDRKDKDTVDQQQWLSRARRIPISKL